MDRLPSMTVWECVCSTLRGEQIEAIELVLLDNRRNRSLGTRVDLTKVEKVLRGIDTYEHAGHLDREGRPWAGHPISIIGRQPYDDIAFTFWTASRVMAYRPVGGLFEIMQLRRHPARRKPLKS